MAPPCTPRARTSPDASHAQYTSRCAQGKKRPHAINVASKSETQSATRFIKGPMHQSDILHRRTDLCITRRTAIAPKRLMLPSATWSPHGQRQRHSTKCQLNKQTERILGSKCLLSCELCRDYNYGLKLSGPNFFGPSLAIYTTAALPPRSRLDPRYTAAIIHDDRLALVPLGALSRRAT